LVRANDRLFEITGYTEGELVGRDPRIFYRTDKEYLEVGEKFAEAAETGFARIETRFVRKDQTVIDVVIYIAPLDRGNPDAGSVLVLQDITELKAARQAALEEKTRSQIYLGVVHVMIVVLDTEGRVKLINKKGCEILERSAEQIEGADWFRTFLPASYQEIARGVFNRIIAGEEKAVEYFENPVRTLDGTEKLIAWHNAVLRDEGGRITGIISSGEDVTNVRAADEAKRKSEQQLRVALSAAKMGTWRWSAATGRDIFDDNLKKLLGLTEQDADREYQDLFLFAHPDDREAAKAEFDRAIREHDTYLAYFRIVHPSGEIRWVQDQGTPFYDFNGKLEYVTGVVVDVTERKRADEMLQFTQFAVDRAGEAAYWMGPDAKFIYVNDKASQSLGYAREELLTMSVHDIDPDFPSDIWADHWKHMRKNPSSRFESHHQRKDGVVFPVEITSNFVVYNDKEYVCAFARDITERKAAEQEREILMEQLRQRNDELQSIVFTAAHDLRSPLVNIAGFAGELEKSLRQLEEVLKEAPLNKQLIGRIDHLLKTDITESLEFIRFGSRHMDALLNGLMRLSVVGASPIEHSEVEMKVLINHIIEGLRYQINENIVDISVPDDLPNCFGDSTMLTQVFGNLIDNAIKYRHPERAAVVEIGASIQGDMVDYTVADNGIGIESTHLEKVFELFHRLDSKQEQGGQGMGLTIVRRILDRLGGSAKIDSVPGLGTTVHVRLPRA
jgi:PAS domain S-box-containing protein